MSLHLVAYKNNTNTIKQASLIEKNSPFYIEKKFGKIDSRSKFFEPISLLLTYRKIMIRNNSPIIMTRDKILTPAPHKNSCLCDHYLCGRYNLVEFFVRKNGCYLSSQKMTSLTKQAMMAFSVILAS